MEGEYLYNAIWYHIVWANKQTPIDSSILKVVLCKMLRVVAYKFVKRISSWTISWNYWTTICKCLFIFYSPRILGGVWFLFLFLFSLIITKMRYCFILYLFSKFWEQMLKIIFIFTISSQFWKQETVKTCYHFFNY